MASQRRACLLYGVGALLLIEPFWPSCRSDSSAEPQEPILVQLIIEPFGVILYSLAEREASRLESAPVVLLRQTALRSRALP